MMRLAALGVVACWALAMCTGVAGAGPVASAQTCVLVDTDMDIDDLMSIPTVIGARHVAAIVTTEGYTLPALGASAVSRLVAEPGQRSIPVIVGAGIGRLEPDIAETFGDYVLAYRALMNRLNNFEPVALPPAPVAQDFVAPVVDAVAACRQVDVLLLGAFSSFAEYSPAIRAKIARVVITGRPLEGDPQLDAGESFNCVYDRPSCEKVFHDQLPGLDHAFVDVPRNDMCDLTPNKDGCVGKVFGPTLAMARALGPAGLPNTLKQVLLHDSATWATDTWERSGYGGRSMFWDQSTTLALLDPSAFRQVGAHLETVLSPQAFGDKWVEFTNLAASYS
jgi:inosine-uridine nucleoside N-ribohydrolase